MTYAEQLERRGLRLVMMFIASVIAALTGEVIAPSWMAQQQNVCPPFLLVFVFSGFAMLYTGVLCVAVSPFSASTKRNWLIGFALLNYVAAGAFFVVRWIEKEE